MTSAAFPTEAQDLSRSRRWLAFLSERPDVGGWYLLWAFLTTVVAVIADSRHPQYFAVGDWLINYGGGFVRRGLGGQAILLVAHPLHISPVALACYVCLPFYAVIDYGLWRLYRRVPGFWSFALIVSPVAAMYPVLGSGTAQRKEVLLFALLLGVLAVVPRAYPDAVKSVLIAAAVVTLMLTHEGLAPFLLYVGAAMLLCSASFRRFLGVAILPAIAAVVAVGIAITHKGTASTPAAVCGAIHPADTHICDGAIAYLAYSTQAARVDVLRTEHLYHYLRFYPFLLVLAAIPLVGAWLELRRSGARGDALVIAVTAALAWIGTVPLFRYGSDWGRWIYIHVLCTTMLLLYARRKAKAGNRAESRPESRAPGMWRTAHPAWALALLVLFATCWNMPCQGPAVTRGYLNAIHVLKEMRHGHGRHAG